MEDDVKILVVDDDISQSRTMALVLKKKGYSVFVANSGQEALHLCEKEDPIDIVFMDVKMPVMNGVETYKKMKAICPETVVIMMTAYAVEELVREALTEGAYSVIYKPIDFEITIEMISNAVKVDRGAFVLVVDDDESTRRSFKGILEHKGYAVVTASSGEEAIERVTKNHFDVVFLDMKLPTLNGLETYLKIRKIREDVVVVIITGHQQTMESLIEEALVSSVYTCFHKPVDMNKILQMIREIIAKKECV